MDIETAKKINGAMVDYYLHEITHKGVPAGPPPDYSLRDMAEAARLMDGYSEPGDTPGSRTLFTTCADRLVAAMYTLGHYPPCDLDELEVVIAGHGKALVCLRQRDLLNLARAWKEYEDCDCAACGRVDALEASQSRIEIVDLLRQALEMLSLMPIDPSDSAITEKMEDLLEAVWLRFGNFVWRKAGGAYSFSTGLDVFEEKKVDDDRS